MRIPRPLVPFLLLLAVLSLTAQRCSDTGSTDPPAGGPAPPATVLGTESVARGLAAPVFATSPRGDARLFIVERAGIIRVLENGLLGATPFLDIRALVRSGGEQGLLGLAFAPDFVASRLFYINYTDVLGNTVVARYRVAVGEPTVAEVLLRIPQPFANHNGGTLAFGIDGFLYIGMGDGGGAGDPGNLAQNDATLLGKMLRIDVSGGLGSGYRIPADNPFAGGALPFPEIWSKGLRNPYRFSFDRVMGDLYIADVGQGSLEEVNVARVGSFGGFNYGWRLMEGTACFNPAAGCDDGTLTLPVYEYGHDGGRCSVTGGYVYRGSIRALFGHYLFADYCSNQVFSFVWDGAGGVTELTDRTAQLAPAGGFRAITAFGEDGFGELYVVQFGDGVNDGEVFRIVERSASGVRRAPAREAGGR